MLWKSEILTLVWEAEGKGKEAFLKQEKSEIKAEMQIKLQKPKLAFSDNQKTRKTAFSQSPPAKPIL